VLPEIADRAQSVEEEQLGGAVAHGAEDQIARLLGALLQRRVRVDEEDLLPEKLGPEESESGQRLEQLVLRLRSYHAENHRQPARRGEESDLAAEDGLPAARSPGDAHQLASRDASAQERVEARDAGREQVRGARIHSVFAERGAAGDEVPRAVRRTHSA